MTSDCLPHQVPLAATFRGVSCVTANAASKAILRVAVDELMREEEEEEQQQQQQGGGMGGGGGAGPAGEGTAPPPPRPLPNPSPLAAGEGTASSTPEEGEEGEEGEGTCAGRIFYWPAYEMVKEGFSEAYLEDGRHPKPEVVCHHLLRSPLFSSDLL